jgi:magnesium-transporting ATPase (P-type)
MSQINLEEIVLGASEAESNSNTVIPKIVPVPRGSLELKRNQTFEEYQATEASLSSSKEPSRSPRDARIRHSVDEVANVTAVGVGLSHRISVEIQSRTSNQIRQSIDQRQHKLQCNVASASTSQSPAQARIELREFQAAKKVAEIVAHTYSFPELATIFHTDLVNGISAHDSKSRLLRDGPNRLTPPRQTPWWVKLIKQLVGGFQLMLIGAAALCWVVGNLSSPVDEQTNFLGHVLITVVVVTGVFAFFQEAKSDKVMEVWFTLRPHR